MKSIIAVAGNEALGALKSHVIAAPLAKLFTAKHFGETISEADAYLEDMGVVEGLDGMNFNMSKIFSTDEPEGRQEDVHIVVYYKLRIVQLFGWVVLEVPMCKESVARAWLGGDDVKAVVEPMVPSTEEDASTEEAPGDENGDTDQDKEPEEEKEVNTGIWAGTDAEREQAFGTLLDNTFGTPLRHGSIHYSGNYDESIAYTFNAKEDWDYQLYEDDDGTMRSQGADYISALSKRNLKLAAAGIPFQSDGVTPTEFTRLTYVIYVPENLPVDQLDLLVDDVLVAKKDVEKYIASNEDGVSPDMEFGILIMDAGGTVAYDDSAKDEG